MFIRIWRFRPRVGAEREFEELYGERGGWTTLFQRGRGYLGTELRRVSTDPLEYYTVDRWESRAAWEDFRRCHETLYERLDQQGQLLTDLEEPVQELESSDPHDTA